MVSRILLATQITHDFVYTPASQNVWLAGMAEGLAELGFEVCIPFPARNQDSVELSRARRRFIQDFGLDEVSESISFVDGHDLLTHRDLTEWDLVWGRDPELLRRCIASGVPTISEFHGGARERGIGELATSHGLPLVTVAAIWHRTFPGSVLADPGALKIFFSSRPVVNSVARIEGLSGVYAGGLDPDRIDGIGVRALHQMMNGGVSLGFLGGNLALEARYLKHRLHGRPGQISVYGYQPPYIATKLFGRSDFAIALKAAGSSPSAPLKLIAYAAARLPIVASSAFREENLSGLQGRALKVSYLGEGLNPLGGKALETALENSDSWTEENLQIARDNTWRRRIEKTGLLERIEF
jgi:hypothetical protein